MTADLLHTLCWYRLRASVVNTRVVPKASAHPLSIFQAMVKGVTLSMGASDGATPDPFFHLVGRRHTATLRQGDRFQLEVFFCSRPFDYAEAWRDAFSAYLMHPETGKNFSLEDLAPLEHRTLVDLEREQSGLSQEREICLDFLTPLTFTPERDRQRTFLSRNRFTQMIDGRLTRLFDTPLSYRGGDDEFELLPSTCWKFITISHESKSQKGVEQLLKGCVGKLYLRGDFTNLRPWLLFASELHQGKKVPSGQGYFVLLPGGIPPST